jgi:protein TIF31
MIARAFKHVANIYLRDLPMAFATSCLAHLLNCLLGTGLNNAPKPYLDEDLQDFYKDADYSFARVTPQSLRPAIKAQVQLRYRHSLEDDWTQDIKHLQLLRSIALKLGLQLIAKDYHFTAETYVPNGESKVTTNGSTAHAETNGHAPGVTNGKKKKKNGGRNSPSHSNDLDMPGQPQTFSADDIANLVPIVKDACPKSVLAEEALEAGKISMMQNQKEIGQELLLESLTLHEQIYGILHPEVARVYHQLAMLYYQLDEKNAAIELAHKAVIISERTLGIDSSETILAYLNLALFEHHNSNTDVAISCVRHALELWKIIYGPKHPDSITTLNNAAVMLQNLKLYTESRQWFEMSLSISEEVSGKSSVNTATLLFQLAQALVLDQDHKGAVNRMREAYSIFLSKLGAEDPNTKESEKWLEQLTQNAVSMAKHAKDVQARRVRRVMFNPRVSTMGARPQPQVGQSTADMVNGHDAIGLSILEASMS